MDKKQAADGGTPAEQAIEPPTRVPA